MSYGVLKPRFRSALSEQRMTDIGDSNHLSQLEGKMLMAEVWAEPRDRNMKGSSEVWNLR